MGRPQGRLIIDPPASGTWNMAVDQALLETAELTGKITFRIYFWKPATVSLGYFQKYGDREQHLASSFCPIVRRKTGGGAIVHDREITYSLCVPSHERWSSANRDLYDTIHRSLIDLMAGYGISGELYSPPTGSNSTNSAKDAFLCFQRRAEGDLILDGHKVGGSAQRRLKKSLLQHGSILFEKSTSAPELPGIADLSATCPSLDEFVEKWLESLSASLRIDLHSDSLSEEESQLAAKVQQAVFDSENWTKNR